MAYTDIAYHLLNKRCNFLDSQLSWPTSIGEGHPAGRRYRHFRANGLTLINAHKATRGSEYPDGSSSLRDHTKYHGEAISHSLEQFAVAFEDVRDVTLHWHWVSAYGGTNPFDHPLNNTLGSQLRYPWDRVMARAYTRHPGLVSANSTGHVKQLYYPFELSPANTTGDLRNKLLVAARARPLRYQLWHRNYNQTTCSVWSARLAGFPDANFYYSTSHVPSAVKAAGSTSHTQPRNYTQCLYANPTVLLTTMEVPEGYDEWAADPAMNGSSVKVTFHSRWVSVPHWMGYAINVDDAFYGRSSQNRVPYQSYNWPNMSTANTGIFVTGGKTSDRDLLLCNPGDTYLDDNPMPLI